MGAISLGAISLVTKQGFLKYGFLKQGIIQLSLIISCTVPLLSLLAAGCSDPRSLSVR
jgi:hypothetical protein